MVSQKGEDPALSSTFEDSLHVLPHELRHYSSEIAPHCPSTLIQAAH